MTQTWKTRLSSIVLDHLVLIKYAQHFLIMSCLPLNAEQYIQLFEEQDATL